VLGAFPSPLQMKQICDAPQVAMVFREVSLSSLQLECDVLHGGSLVVHLVVRWCWFVVVCLWSLMVRFSFAPSHGHFR